MSCPSHGLMSVDEVLQRLQQVASQKTPVIEQTLLSDALGRVLAEDVVATIDVPPQANSAMDGYAVYTDDLQHTTILAISQRIAAGSAPQSLQRGTAARIFTGAVIPDGANAVVMQENTQLTADGLVEVLQRPDAQENIRPQGQDIACGVTILRQGEKLTPAAIGLLATIGKAKVKVYQRLKVVYFCTGDELAQAEQTLKVGQIYNSNSPLLGALLTEQGYQAIDGGVIADNLPDTINALANAAQQADVVMTTGGVSVGEEDHVKTALQQIGQLDLWKVALKPGKPLAFGSIGTTPFIGLPGNPQSVFVTFKVMAQTFLAYYQGQRHKVKPSVVAMPIDFSIKKAQGRQEYLRVRLVQNEQGELVLSKYHNQSSGVLSSAVWADGFAIIEIGKTYESGDRVAFWRF